MFCDSFEDDSFDVDCDLRVYILSIVILSNCDIHDRNYLQIYGCETQLQGAMVSAEFLAQSNELIVL